MSGKLLARASAISLTLLLAACGGDDGSTPIVNVSTGTGEGTTSEEDATPSAEPESENPTTETPENPGTDQAPSTLALGTGTGTSFSAGTLGLESSAIASGFSTELKFNIVDTEDNNSLAVNVSEPNSIIFTSACLDSDRASIEAPSSITSGTVLATYDSGTCIGSDTIYAFLNSSAEVYGSAPVTITPPQEIDLALGILDTGTNNFTPNQISVSSTQALPIGSSVRVGVSIVDLVSQDLQIGQPFTVEFSAQCAEAENGSGFSQEAVNTTTGIAETIYTVGACPSEAVEQTVYAKLGGQDQVPMAQTSISTEANNAFQLVAGIPTPQSIAPSFLSQENRETVSTISFTLKDSTVSGNGLEGEPVNLRIDELGVAEFLAPDGSTTDTLPLVTDANGRVSATVRAKTGIDQQVFRIIATSNNIETISMPIAVNSKLPYEPRFSISTTNFAPDVQGKDGVQVELTVLAADDEGNRIRGNTPVNFTTTQGSINPDCVLDNEGRCTITWESLAIDNYDTLITAETHGRREDGSTGSISDNITMLMSDSDGVQVELIRTDPVDTQPFSTESNTYCATTFVSLPNGQQARYSPPVGTEIAFEVTEGELVNEATGSATIGSDESLVTAPGFEACTDVRPQETVESIPDGNGGFTDVTTFSILIDVTVTPPGENVTPATDFIQE